MRFLGFLVTTIFINLSTCLITLKDSTLNKDYEIGGISNLYLYL